MSDNKKRIDEILVLQNLVETRNKAQALILQGKVFYWNDKKSDWKKVEKAGEKFASQEIKIKIENPFPADVGRGALKLRAALNQWPQIINLIKNAHCLDVGASTGGFTQVLLENMASGVVAIDVGRNQLHERLKSNPKVINLEKTHILNIEDNFWSENKISIPFDVIVTDLSFISLYKVIDKVSPWLKNTGVWILLVKPQFELEAKKVPKGIVKDESYRLEAINKILSKVKELSHYEKIEYIDCPVAGTEGNREYLLYLQKKS
jgi:23S rRNA (cytidine1920-2'-O)/16S rRNA (cytidine1409-2'-O)-methyltransferase